EPGGRAGAARRVPGRSEDPRRGQVAARHPRRARDLTRQTRQTIATRPQTPHPGGRRKPGPIHHCEIRVGSMFVPASAAWILIAACTFSRTWQGSPNLRSIHKPSGSSKGMFDALLSLLTGSGSHRAYQPNDPAFALAALLIETARSDDRVEPREQRIIER